MKKMFSVSKLFLLVVLCFTLFTPSALALEFKDVKATDPAHKAISNLSDRKIIGGFTDGTFRPDQSVTRGQASKFIAETLGLGNSKPAKAKFKDVPVNHQFAAYIHALSDKGIIGGYTDGTFRPNDTITRAQVSKMLVTGFAVKMKANPTLPYKDVNASIWYAANVKALYSHGVLLTTNKTTLSPNTLVTRRDMAKYIYDTEVAVKGHIESDAEVLKKIRDQVSKIKIEPIVGNFIPYPKLDIPDDVNYQWNLYFPGHYEYHSTATSKGIYLDHSVPTNIKLTANLQFSASRGNTADSINIPIIINKKDTSASMDSIADLSGLSKEIVFSFISNQEFESIDISKFSFHTNNETVESVKFDTYTESDSREPGTFEWGTNIGETPYSTQVTIYLTNEDFKSISSLKEFGNPNFKLSESDYIYAEEGFVEGALPSASQVFYKKPVKIILENEKSISPLGYVGFKAKHGGRMIADNLDFTRESPWIEVPDYLDRVTFLNVPAGTYLWNQLPKQPTDRQQEIKFNGTTPDVIYLKDGDWTTVGTLK